jgi:hypothetical protein
MFSTICIALSLLLVFTLLWDWCSEYLDWRDEE